MSVKTTSGKTKSGNPPNVEIHSDFPAGSMIRNLSPRAILPWARKRLPYLRDEFQHVANRLWNFAEDELFSGALKPPADISESVKSVDIVMDVPGFDPEDIEIRVQENMLTVRSRRSTGEGEADKDEIFHRIERPRGNFSRTFALPCDFNGDETATCKNGVLTISIPKAKGPAARKIKIRK